jgi:hypothetical protein
MALSLLFQLRKTVGPIEAMPSATRKKVVGEDEEMNGGHAQIKKSFQERQN